MFSHALQLSPRAGMRIGSIVSSLCPLNLLLSEWYIGYFHLTGHARSISKYLVSSLLLVLGFVVFANGYCKSDPEPSEPKS